MGFALAGSKVVEKEGVMRLVTGVSGWCAATRWFHDRPLDARSHAAEYPHWIDTVRKELV